MKLIKALSVVGLCLLSQNAIASNHKNNLVTSNLIHTVRAGDPKTVVVRPYIKRNGTIVAPHTRSLPRK